MSELKAVKAVATVVDDIQQRIPFYRGSRRLASVIDRIIF